VSTSLGCDQDCQIAIVLISSLPRPIALTFFNDTWVEF
jgi:hypothetical protein